MAANLLLCSGRREDVASSTRRCCYSIAAVLRNRGDLLPWDTWGEGSFVLLCILMRPAARIGSILTRMPHAGPYVLS